jgi:hypothetical protein
MKAPPPKRRASASLVALRQSMFWPWHMWWWGM